MSEIIIPENFKSIVVDFTNDLSITFPEYSYLWDRWKTDDESVYLEVFEHCLKSFPERFFDILYQNVEIFEPTNETNTVFLPNIDFKLLYNCQGVSENTKKTIWKYLQLLLFTVIGSVKDKSIFGDTANMFDGIDENDLQEKFNLLEKFIAELNEMDKALIMLYLEEKSYLDISEIMGISVSNVGTKMGRIKEKLKKRFLNHKEN